MSRPFPSPAGARQVDAARIPGGPGGEAGGGLWGRQPSNVGVSRLDAQVDLYPFFVLLVDAIILAQRMALPVIGQQDAPQVGMALEADPEHVEALALQPVRRGPERDHAGR